MEPYAYVYNNPVMMIDPTGMEGEDASSDSGGGETNVNNNEINIIGNISIARNSASIESYDFGDTSRRMGNVPKLVIEFLLNCKLLKIR